MICTNLKCCPFSLVVCRNPAGVIPQEGLVPFINLVGCVKFSTAGEDKGLCTGKTDVTVGLRKRF